MAPMPIRRYDKDFILDRIAIHPDTGCWHWAMQMDNKGYGRVSYGSGEVLVHRLSWKLFMGEIPNYHEIMHKCDNPICCNPDHLSVGTHTDNMKDAMDKGRVRLNDYGGWNKLPSQAVNMMYDMFEKGVQTQEIMKATGASRSSVKLYRRNWKSNQLNRRN